MTIARGADSTGARRAYALLAFAAVALTLAVIVASAYLRHAQAGLSCEPWPSCYARAAMTVETPPDAVVRAARIAHRLSATAVTVAILGLLLVTWTQRPIWLREALVATAALAVAGALAVLGVLTPGSKSPVVVLGNLLGGYLLMTLLAVALAFAFEQHPARAGARAVAFAACACGFVVAALGGLIGAHYASSACRALLDCGTVLADAFPIARIDWMSPPANVDGRFVAPDWAPQLHIAHRAFAIVLGAFLALLVRHDRRRVALGLLAALALTAILGAVTAVTRPLLWVVVLHNAAAATTLALLAAMAAHVTARIVGAAYTTRVRSR